MAKTVTFNVRVRDGSGNASVTAARAGVDEPPMIESVIIDPPVVPPGGVARITIVARDPEGGTLSYEVVASEGNIERTNEPNVFLWRAP